MAANYTRLIEFKVKDTELNRAVKNLSKTLDKIDKTLVGIDKKLDHIAKHGFAMVSKEAVKTDKSIKEVEKSVNRVSKALDKWSKGANAKSNEFLKLERVLSNNAGLVKKVALFATLSAGIVRASKDIRTLVGNVNAFTQANNVAIQSIFGLVAGLEAVRVSTPFVYNLGKGFRQLTHDIGTAHGRIKKFGLEGGLLSFAPKGSHMGNRFDKLRGQPFDGDKAAATVEKEMFRGQSSPLHQESLRSLKSRETLLQNNKKIQESLAAFTGKHLQASIQVRNAQVRYNIELAKTRLVQAAVTADIWAAQKAWQGVVGVLKGAKNLFGGLLGGKFGGAGQAAGVISLSRSIEFLTGKLGFLNNQWINNAKAASQWVTRVTEAVATVNIAYTGLTKVLGAANWTIGAIAGFKRWENEASQAIWRVDRQARNLAQSLAAAFWMMQGKGGTPGGVAQNLKDMALGGVERQENIRYAGQGPTELQNLQRDLDLQATKLKQRNVGEADYIKILQRQKQIKLEMLTIEDQIKTKRIEAGVSTASEQFEKEYNAFKEQVDKKSKAAKKAANDITKLEKQEATQRNKLQADAAKNYERLENNKEKRAKQRHKDAIKREKELAVAARRSQQQRRRRRGRIGENLMLGAGFPLLFGGGAGAVGGGVLGAGIQAATGSEGFGAQILFSALGQQVDAFVGKISTLGKAFNTLNPDVDAVIGSLGETNTVFGKHLEMLKNIKGEKAAMAAATAAVERIVGKRGLAKLQEFGQDATNLGNEWAKVMLRMQASVAALITRTGILKKLAESMAKGTDFQKANVAVITGTASPELTKLFKLYEEQSTFKGAIKNYLQNPIPWSRPTNKDGTPKFPSKRELIPMIIKQFRGDQDRSLLGSGADKIAALDAQKLKLEQILKIGEKRATIEEKIRNKQKDGITLSDEEYRKKLNEIDSLKVLNDMYQQIGQTIKDGMVNAIEGLILKTNTLKEAASDTLRIIARMMLQMGVSKVMAGMGFPERAHGGPVTGNSSYLVGERGPEIFTPKRSGAIVPNDKIGGGGSTSVVVNVDATGGSAVQGDEPSAQQLGRMIGAAVQAEIVKQKRPGGILA